MRTLVVSDLHLGCAACPGLFAGADALASLLAELGPAPLRVVLNGDTFDFPAQAGAGGDAASAMRSFVEDAEGAQLLARLGRIVAAGGELIVRAGEHDCELVEPAVQALVVRGLELARTDERRVVFHARRALLLRVGGARVLVARRADGRGDASRWLAEHLLNPLRRQYGVGLADLLRPDYAGAVLAAFAVNPIAAKLVLRQLELEIDRAPPQLRAAFAGAGLSEREARVVAVALDPDAVLGPLDYEVLQHARLKLFRHSLGRRVAPRDGLRAIVDREWDALRSAARRRRATAWLIGHSHIAGWRDEDGLVVADTGAWSLSIDPPPSSDVHAWRRRLDAWQRITRIDRLDAIQAAGAGVSARFTAAMIDPLAAEGGARLVLGECRPGRRLVALRERRLPPGP